MCTCQYAAFTHHPPLIFPLLSSALLSVPADALVIRQPKKQRLLLSAGAGRSCQSLQLCLMIAFQMTLWSSLHTVCFSSMMKFSSRGVQQGTSLKRGSNAESHTCPKKPIMTILSHRRKEHNRVGGVGIVEMNRNDVFSLQITLRRGDTKAESKLGPLCKDRTWINECNEADLSKLSVVSGLGRVKEEKKIRQRVLFGDATTSLNLNSNPWRVFFIN